MRPVTTSLVAALVASLLAGCSSVVMDRLDVRDLAFAQIDWLDPNGEPFQPASSWGMVSWSYDPGVSSTHYLSVRAQTKEGAGLWILKNFPLFETSQGRTALRESSFFDWQELGYEEGEPVEAIEYELALQTEPAAEPAITIGRSTVLVAPEGHALCDEEETGDPGDDPPGGAAPGRPQPARSDGTARRGHEERDVRAVQEANRHCVAGAFARSLDWLNREHDLGLGKDATGFYDDLVAAGVSQRNRGGDEGWLALKDRYARAQSGNRIVTKLWNFAGEGGLDPIPGIPTDRSTAISFKDWIQREMADGEDVEVAFKERSRMEGTPFRHIVTAVDLVLQRDGDMIIKYRDDERQGNDRGDGSIKSFKVVMFEGNAHLGRIGRQVTFAVSESVVAPPSTSPSTS